MFFGKKRFLNFFCVSAPDSGALNNTKTFRRTTPTSFRSPFVAQGDLGYIFKHKKKYGLFFVAVQTWTGRVFACSIKNKNKNSLVQAISLMLKDKAFGRTATLLFDGESGLNSKKTQKEIYDKFRLKIYATPFFKRNHAERAIKEIKLRLAIAMDLKGKQVEKRQCKVNFFNKVYVFFRSTSHALEESSR